MNDDTSDNLPNYDPGLVNSIIRMLGELGWLRDNQFVDGEQLQIKYSPQGHQNMEKLAAELKQCLPELASNPMPTAPPVGSALCEVNEILFKIFLSKALLLFPELFSKIKTADECKIFMGFILLYKKENADTSSPLGIDQTRTDDELPGGRSA